MNDDGNPYACQNLIGNLSKDCIIVTLKYKPYTFGCWDFQNHLTWYIDNMQVKFK